MTDAMHWAIFLSLVVVQNILAENSTQCFAHDDCLQPGHFCAWSICIDETGDSISCGMCRPCKMCICHKDSTDFFCPTRRCPAQPVGVRFLQGRFHSHSTLFKAPDYDCIRQFEITGNVFSISQLPIYSSHPATTGILNGSDIILSECSSYTRSGVLGSLHVQPNGQIKFDVIVSSEGDINVERQLYMFLKSPLSR